MIASLSFGSFLLTSVLLVVLYIISNLIIIPYVRVNSYKSKGKDVITYFYPILGFLKYFQECFFKHGDVFGGLKQMVQKNPDHKFFVTNIKSDVTIFIQDSAYIKEVLQKPHLYVKAAVLDPFRAIIGGGLLFVEGDKWKAHRKFVSKSFHYEFLKNNIPMIQETTKEFFEKLKPEDLKDYAVITRIQEITGEIVGRIFFGKNLNNYSFEGKPLTLKLADLFGEMAVVTRNPLTLFLGHKIVIKLPFMKNYRKFFAHVEGFRAVCHQIIQDRKTTKEEGSDFLCTLLKSQEADDHKERYTDEEIIDEFITFFAAGMDTTGHLIGMTLYNLTQYPEYLKELKEERDSAYNKENIVSAETIQGMDVVHLHLKETLRLYTPAASIFNRRVIADHKLLDLDLKKGDHVKVDLLSTLSNPKYFENPNDYVPNRWKNANMKIDPYAYIPFCAGPRNCIGQHLAIIESKIILSEFLNRFDFKPKEGYKLRMKMGFLYEPADEFMLDLTLKN